MGEGKENGKLDSEVLPAQGGWDDSFKVMETVIKPDAVSLKGTEIVRPRGAGLAPGHQGARREPPSFVPLSLVGRVGEQARSPSGGGPGLGG